MKITLNGKEVDLDKALPIQLRDLRRLKKEFGVEFGLDGLGGDVEKQACFFLVLFQKVFPEITPDDVDSMSLAQMSEVSQAAAQASRAADVPSSASSIS